MTRTRTPLWVRATASALLLVVLGWLTWQHLERRANEHRLAAIASQIAGRPVKVHCPGIIGRFSSAYDVTEGSVQFDAEGRPADMAGLRAAACDELDALAEGRRAAVLRCLCGQGIVDLASAVDTLTHESVHLSGIAAEGITECRSMARMAWTGRQLGATAEQAAALERLVRTELYPRMPDQYRADCSSSPGAPPPINVP